MTWYEAVLVAVAVWLAVALVVGPWVGRVLTSRG